MLPATAAAYAEYITAGLPPAGAGVFDRDDLAARMAGALLHDANPDPVARRSEGHEDDTAVGEPADPVSAAGKTLDFDPFFRGAYGDGSGGRGVSRTGTLASRLRRAAQMRSAMPYLRPMAAATC